jgi:transposase-like protein
VFGRSSSGRASRRVPGGHRRSSAYTRSKNLGPNIGTGSIIPVTNPIERLNKQVKRRADVVGIFPTRHLIMRPIGAVLFKQNDEWQKVLRAT